MVAGQKLDDIDRAQSLGSVKLHGDALAELGEGTIAILLCGSTVPLKLLLGVPLRAEWRHAQRLLRFRLVQAEGTALR